MQILDMAKAGVAPASIVKVAVDGHRSQPDLLAVEEPLEIRIGYGPEKERIQKNVAVTMRTPGHDFELAAGFLFTEGLIQSMDQIHQIRYCTDGGRHEERENVVRVELKPGLEPDLRSVERNFYTTSSCGVCGKTSIDAVHTSSCFAMNPDHPVFSAAQVHQFPDILRQQQNVFEHTGGLHAAAVFDTDNNLVLLREDVGRHNALDKVIGAALAANQLPLSNHLLMVSGRASFELVQKAVMAGIPILGAVGAPSSLARDLAEESGMTLLGFVRNEKFNLYTGQNRIDL